jgi:hypothetical protein
VPPACADLLPLWEAGLGLAVVDFPDYPGADERTTYAVPLPYFVYRGERFKIDRDGIRGLFFESDRVELDVSANASIPVKSTENQARQGMPDLDPTFQIGPTVNFTLHRDPDRKLQIRLPVRGVVATDFTQAKGAGLVFEPQLVLDINKLEAVFGLALRRGRRAAVRRPPLQRLLLHSRSAIRHGCSGLHIKRRGVRRHAGAALDQPSLQELVGRCVRAVLNRSTAPSCATARSFGSAMPWRADSG